MTTNTTSRREFLKRAAVSGAGLTASLFPVSGAYGETDAKMPQAVIPSYSYRIGFGAWINDMRNDPLPLENWPAPQLDKATIDGAIRAMDVMQEAGYNFFGAFGLWATNDYPVDIVSAFRDEERHRRLGELFTAARQRNIKMALPLGLFTWGYDRIIREDPEVRGRDGQGNPHPHAMCGAKEKSWKYIYKLIDTMMDQFEFDAAHLESADLGYCMCPECAGKYGAVGYNCRLNVRAADYIKGKWSHVLVYTIPINWVPWGLSEAGIRPRQ